MPNIMDGNGNVVDLSSNNVANTNNGKINAQGIASALGGAASAFGTAYSTIADVQSPKQIVPTINSFRLNPNAGGNSLDSWTQSYLNTPNLNSLSLKDVGWNSTKGAFNILGSTVQGVSTGKSFGLPGIIGGGVLGLGAGLWGFVKGKQKANETRYLANEAVKDVNKYNQDLLANSLANIKKNQFNNLLRNYSAFGGPLNMSGDGVLSPFGSRFAFGGNAQTFNTHGGYFSNGVVEINEGKTHEENPYEGVQMGIDPQGVPNLVEEGEVIWNDYVFSNRMKVPKRDRIKYKLTGPKNLTYAEAAKKAQKESEERPNDPISKRGLEEAMARLANSQEEQRQKDFMREIEKQAKELGMTPEELLYAMQQQQQQPMVAAYGGSIHIKPSKRGTFTAAAKKHGKSVQEFASQVLANKDNYSSAMVKKANFAKNAAGWKHGLGGNLFYGGGRPLFISVGVDDNDIYRGSTIELPEVKEESPVSPSNNNTAPFTDDEWKWFMGLDPKTQLDYTFASYSDDPDPTNQANIADWRQLGFSDEDFLQNNWNYWREQTVNSVKDFYNKRNAQSSPKSELNNFNPLPLTERIKANVFRNVLGSWPFRDIDRPSISLPTADTRPLYQRDIFGIQNSDWLKEPAPSPRELTLRSTATTTNNDSINRGYDWTTGLRYTPILASAISGIRNLLTPADYSRANDVERAYSNINDVKVTPKYNYMQYRPIDRMMMANMIGQQAAATRRNIMNTSGGNRGTAIAGLLASDNQYLNKLGEAFIAGDAENYKRYAQTLDTNNKINQWLGQLDLNVQEANQRAAEARAKGVQLSRSMMDATDAQRAAAISNDWTNVAQGLGDIGWEQFNRNMVNSSNPIYGIGEDGNVYFKGGERAESLMKRHLSADDYKAWKNAKVNSDEYAQLLSRAFVNMQRGKTFSKGGYLTIKGRKK